MLLPVTPGFSSGCLEFDYRRVFLLRSGYRLRMPSHRMRPFSAQGSILLLQFFLHLGFISLCRGDVLQACSTCCDLESPIGLVSLRRTRVLLATNNLARCVTISSPRRRRASLVALSLDLRPICLNGPRRCRSQASVSTTSSGRFYYSNLNSPVTTRPRRFSSELTCG